MTIASFSLMAVAAVGGMVFLAVVSRNPVRGLYVAIFASAILLTPRLPVVRQKLTACEIVMVLTWVAMLIRQGRTSPLLPSQWVAIRRSAALIGITFISLLAAAVASNIDLVRGSVETANYLYGFLLFLTVIYLVDSWDKWIRCFCAWCCGTAVVCAVAAWSMLGSAPAWTRDEFTGRISSTLRLSNQLPGYCVPVLTLVVMCAAMKDTRASLRMACVVLAGGIMLAVAGSGSRTGLAMVCLCSTLIMYIGLRQSGAQVFSRRSFSAMGTIAAGCVVWAIVSAWNDHDDSYTAGKTMPYERSIRLIVESVRGERSLDATRTSQLKLVWEKAMERPLFGIGPANFTTAFREHEVHNTYAAVLGEEGFVGLFGLIFWLAAVAQNGRLALRSSIGEKRRLIMLAALIGFAVLLLYGLAMFGLRQRPLWFMCGLIVAMPQITLPARAVGRERHRHANAHGLYRDNHATPLAARR